MPERGGGADTTPWPMRPPVPGCGCAPDVDTPGLVVTPVRPTRLMTFESCVTTVADRVVAATLTMDAAEMSIELAWMAPELVKAPDSISVGDPPTETAEAIS